MIIVVLVSLVAAVQAGVFSFGGCPDLRGVENFETEQYLGTWYEYSNTFEIFQIGGKCVRATYTDKAGNVRVLNEQVDKRSGSYKSITGSARQELNSTRGELIVSFDTVPEFATGSSPNYLVLDTDYTSFALVYSCTNLPFNVLKTESVWVLTREQQPAQALVDQVYSKARELGLPVDKISQTVQEDCEALPPIST